MIFIQILVKHLPLFGRIIDVTIKQKVIHRENPRICLTSFIRNISGLYFRCIRYQVLTITASYGLLKPRRSSNENRHIPPTGVRYTKGAERAHTRTQTNIIKAFIFSISFLVHVWLDWKDRTLLLNNAKIEHYTYVTISSIENVCSIFCLRI